MAVEWEWSGSGSLERSIEIVPWLSPDEDEHGGADVFEEFAPSESLSFQATGVPKADLNELKAAAKVRKSQYELTDNLGDEYTGYIGSLRWDNIRGCDRFNVTLTLLLPPEAP